MLRAIEILEAHVATQVQRMEIEVELILIEAASNA